ncbi:MAG: hypothetical protein WC678_01610 [Parcubacteria group bacterium]
MIEMGAWAYEEYRRKQYSKAIFWLKPTVARFIVLTLVIIFLACMPEYKRFSYERAPSIDGVYAKIISIEKVIETEGRDPYRIYVVSVDIGYGNIREAILEIHGGSAPSIGNIVAIASDNDADYRDRMGDGRIIRPKPLAWL